MNPFHFAVQRKVWALAGLIAGLLLLGAGSVSAQGPDPASPKPKVPTANTGTAFTYQGQLKNNGTPVNDTCDFKFDLFDAATAGFHTAGPVNQTGVPVNDGLFTTAIDFGANVFTGDARWLHFAVACPTGGSYTPLNSREALTPAPIALSLPGLRTDQSGNSPNVIIHGSDAALQIQSVASNTYPRTIYTADAREWHTGVGGSGVINGLNSEYYIYDASANQTRLVIDTNGSVGIGTTSPGVPLEVNAADSAMRVRNSNDTGGGFIGNTYNALELGIYNPSGSAWGVVPANTIRSYFGIANSGWVGSLTNSFPGLTFRNLLDDGSGNSFVTGNARVGGTVEIVTLGAAGATSLCRNNFDEVATCSSSLRYKNNIADLPLGLETVMQLRPVTYDWKSTGEHDLGLVAEEVNAVAPILTTYNKDGQIEGVKYDRLTAVLVKGIQEQQQQIADVKATNAAQQDVIAQLKRDDADIKTRLAALEQASPSLSARAQSPDWSVALAFVVGAVAVVAVDRTRKGSK